MGDLIKVVMCGIGCIYLLMHVAYALTSANDSIKNRNEDAEEVLQPTRNCTLDHDVAARRQDAVGFEQKTSS